MKKFMCKIVLTAVAAAIMSCASKPESKTAFKDTPEYKVIDFKDKAMGAEIPDWVTAGIDELEQTKYPKDYVFVISSPEGQSREGVLSIAKNLDAPQEIAQMVTVRIKSKAVGHGIDSKDVTGQAVVRAAETISKAKITGLRKRGEFWVKKRFFNSKGETEKEIFEAKVLYTVPRDVIDELIKNELKKALGQVAPSMSEEDKASAARAEDIFKNGLNLGDEK